MSLQTDILISTEKDQNSKHAQTEKYRIGLFGPYSLVMLLR